MSTGKAITKQVRIDPNFHKELRKEAFERESSIRNVLEEKAGWKASTPISKTSQKNDLEAI